MDVYQLAVISGASELRVLDCLARLIQSLYFRSHDIRASYKAPTRHKLVPERQLRQEIQAITWAVCSREYKRHQSPGTIACFLAETQSRKHPWTMSSQSTPPLGERLLNHLQPAQMMIWAMTRKSQNNQDSYITPYIRCPSLSTHVSCLWGLFSHNAPGSIQPQALYKYCRVLALTQTVFHHSALHKS